MEKEVGDTTTDCRRAPVEREGSTWCGVPVARASSRAPVRQLRAGFAMCLGRHRQIQADARVGEDVTHGRINPGVGAQDVVPRSANQQSRIAHRGSADTHEVDFHQ